MSVDFERILLNESTEMIPTEFVNQADLYRHVLQMYFAAIKQVQTKLEILNDELQITAKRTPIETIKFRLKTSESIIKKMTRYGMERTIENLDKINDIAGLRVICTYIDDIYDIANMLVKQDDVTLIKIKDYIKKPKSSGYRSLHLVIEVPVFFSNMKKLVKVEIQIRTIAMDFWASLEHDMKYKEDIEESSLLLEELKKCAENIHETDIRMQNIKRRIRENNNETI